MRELVVTEAGPVTTIQDRGRVGWAHLGVPRAGALDAAAAALANRLVGNPEDAALLESTWGGVSFSLGDATAVAVTGAPCPVSVDGRAVAWGEALSLGQGVRVVVGPATHGVRSYVAVAGGIDVEPVLGSRSTDTFAFIGPPPVRAGMRLPVGDPRGGPREIATTGARMPDSHALLRYDIGPRADWFSRAPAGAYEVSADSNRIGLRLRGATLARTRTEELPSEGIVLGAIQVPADGQPIVFLNDHPTTGGYPVVGVLLPEDLAVCAQLRPGAFVHLTPRR